VLCLESKYVLRKKSINILLTGHSIKTKSAKSYTTDSAYVWVIACDTLAVLYIYIQRENQDVNTLWIVTMTHSETSPNRHLPIEDDFFFWGTGTFSLLFNGKTIADTILMLI